MLLQTTFHSILSYTQHTQLGWTLCSVSLNFWLSLIFTESIICFYCVQLFSKVNFNYFRLGWSRYVSLISVLQVDMYNEAVWWLLFTCFIYLKEQLCCRNNLSIFHLAFVVIKISSFVTCTHWQIHEDGNPAMAIRCDDVRFTT